MPALKDFLNQDMSVFFNEDEFSSTHNINGKNTLVTVDNDKLMERTQKDFNGMSIGEILYYVKADDFGELPEQGTSQSFDGRNMYVFNAREDKGVYEIILQQFRGA